MSEKTQSEEFNEDEEVEESPGAGDELDIEHLIDDLDKLRFHGARVIRDVSALVRYVNQADNAKFVEKVHEVQEVPLVRLSMVN